MDNEESLLDRTLFESLYHRYFAKVYRFLLRHTKDSQDAEDLAHDVFLKFWNYRDSYSLTIPADAQLLVIAKQIVINRYRKEVLRKEAYQGQEIKVFTHSDDAETILREADASEIIRRALNDLPPKRREIFQKSRFEVMTYDEIATDMGISKNTVESQMVKALKFLKERLAHLSYLFLLFCPVG